MAELLTPEDLVTGCGEAARPGALIIAEAIIASGGDPDTRATRWSAFDLQANIRRVGAAFAVEPERLDQLWHRLSKLPGNQTQARRLRVKIKKAAAEAARGKQFADLESRLSSRVSVLDALEGIVPPSRICPTEFLSALEVPMGYEMDRFGVWKLSVRGHDLRRDRVLNAPMFVISRTEDRVSHTAYRQVLWLGPGRWYSRVVGREELLLPRLLEGLVQFEAPVDGHNSAKAAKFFSDFDRANSHRMSVVMASRKMGWQEDGTFLMPGDHIRDVGDPQAKLVPPRGHEMCAAGWQTKGSFAQWKATVRTVSAYPYMMLVLFASAASPLLQIVGQPGFALDLSGETSGGKTTALRLAGSVWGRPGDDLPSVMYSWASSRTWVEKTCGMLNHLPMLLDDTKKAKNQRIPRDVVYEHSGGVGRGRGTSDGGVQDVDTWRNILISTGESAIIDQSSDAGLRPRIVTLRGKPLGNNVAIGGPLAEQLSWSVMQHHGHLGRKVAAYLYSVREEWGVIREMFEEIRSGYGADTRSAVVRRHAAQLAVIEMSMRICAEFGVVPADNCDPMAYMLRACQDSSRQADTPFLALQELLTFASGSSHRFWGRHQLDGKGEVVQPRSGFIGCWDSREDWEYIGFTVALVERTLRDRGYVPKEIMRRWATRGWLKLTRSGRYPTRRIGARSINKGVVLCVTREAFILATMSEDDEHEFLRQQVARGGEE